MSDVPPPPPPPPPPAAGGVPPAGAYSPAASGQLGKPRSKLLVILLSIVTLGIWTIVWSYQNGDELKRYSGNGLGGTAYLLIMLSSLIIPIIGPVVVMFVLAGEVEKLYRAEGKQPPITAIWGLWFLLPIIGQFIWYFRIQNSINDFWVAHGSTEKPGV